MNTILINDKSGKVRYLVSQPAHPIATLLLAHGAGSDMNQSFLVKLDKLLTAQNIRVIRFNFPYKERGKKMPGSPKEAILALQKMSEWALTQFPDQPLYLSGKSYGGRMASHLVAEQPGLKIRGLVYFGFPLHAPGKPSSGRAAHLKDISIPQLFLQGTNDALASIDLIRVLSASLSTTTLVEMPGADHSFKVPKTDTRTEDIPGVLVETVVSWIANS